jgi:hypothetical protein
MTKWEYMVRKLNPLHEQAELETDLDASGKEGWELVSITDVSGVPASGSLICTFKRPLAS